jgi:hypothetical protein
LEIAVQDTEIDLIASDVALTVGALGVASVTPLVICPVAEEVADAEPPLFVTVIIALMNLPASPLTGV